MFFVRSATLTASVLLGFGLSGHSSGQAPGDITEPVAAVQVFPDHRSESDWRIRQFWPMHSAHGWQISDLPDGAYKVVVRYAPWKAKDSRPISADSATKELTSKGEGLIIGKSSVIDFPQAGFLAFQLINVGDIGLGDSKPVRLHVSFSVRGIKGTASTRLSADVFGPSSSSSPVSKPRWKDGELHFIGFTSKDRATAAVIRYDVLLVRSDVAN